MIFMRDFLDKKQVELTEIKKSSIIPVDIFDFPLRGTGSKYVFDTAYTYYILHIPVWDFLFLN